MRVSTPPPASRAGSEEANRTRRGVLGDVERLDAQPVAAQQHPTAVAFGDREREHAVQVVDEPVTPVVVAPSATPRCRCARRSGSRARAARARSCCSCRCSRSRRWRGPSSRVDHRLGAGFGQVDDLEATMTRARPCPLTMRRRHPGRGAPSSPPWPTPQQDRVPGHRDAPRRWLRTSLRPYRVIRRSCRGVTAGRCAPVRAGPRTALVGATLEDLVLDRAAQALGLRVVAV